MGFFVLIAIGGFLIFACLLFGNLIMMLIGLVFMVIGIIGIKSGKSLRDGYTEKRKAKREDALYNEMNEAQFIARVNEIVYTQNLYQRALNMSGYSINNLTEQDVLGFSGYVTANQSSMKKFGKCYQVGYLVFGEQNMFLYQCFIDNKINNNASEKYDWINYRDMINISENQGCIEIQTLVGKNYNLYIENVEQNTYMKQCLYYRMQSSRG